MKYGSVFLSITLYMSSPGFVYFFFPFYPTLIFNWLTIKEKKIICFYSPIYIEMYFVLPLFQKNVSDCEVHATWR